MTQPLLLPFPAPAPAETYDLVATQNNDTAILPGAFKLLSGTLKIYFLDVDQGDATLIVGPNNEVILIDGGPSQLDQNSLTPSPPTRMRHLLC